MGHNSLLYRVTLSCCPFQNGIFGLWPQGQRGGCTKLDPHGAVRSEAGRLSWGFYFSSDKFVQLFPVPTRRCWGHSGLSSASPNLSPPADPGCTRDTEMCGCAGDKHEAAAQGQLQHHRVPACQLGTAPAWISSWALVLHGHPAVHCV